MSRLFQWKFTFRRTGGVRMEYAVGDDQFTSLIAANDKLQSTLRFIDYDFNPLDWSAEPKELKGGPVCVKEVLR